MISCILLCAGLSLRFGSPKALAKLNGLTVIDYEQQVLLQSSIDEIVVVLGAEADKIKPHILKHKKIKFVHNKDYNLGQTSSFKVGLSAIHKDTKGIMLLPVDFPVIKRSTFDSLVKAFLKDSSLVLIPTFQQKKGHPPIFNVQLKSEFLALDNTFGLNTITHRHPSDTKLLMVDDPGILRSFNTLQEFIQLKKDF